MIITPAGVRVEPEVYWRYATSPGSGSSQVRAVSVADAGCETSTVTSGIRPFPCPDSSRYACAAAALAPLTSAHAGSQSSSTAATRLPCPGWSVGNSGTAITPAVRQPRKAAT